MMKIAFLSLLFCNLLQAQSDLPSTFDALTENYERAIERVTRPLTSKYIEELKKIQRELSGKGDQKGAMEVENKLKDLGAVPWDLAEVLKSKSWEYSANTSTSTVVFRNDGTAEVTGEEVEVWEWAVKEGNILQLKYSGGGTCDFDFADFKTFSIAGKTDQGKRRFLEPMRCH